MPESADPDWWVNSGGRFCRQASLGSTVQGSLPANDRWRTLYASSNPVDTDNGYHPQNIFRFVTKGLWGDVQQTVYFRIRALNMSSSSNRNASNGILFFHRYQDGQNLYYAGVRVDGAAVIKKKLGGTYYTMAYHSGVYPGGSYNATSNPNLLPMDRWVGMRTVIDNASGGVTIRLELDDPAIGSGWTPVIEAEDSGQYGGAAITVSGHAGIRTDFMDVEFDGYEAVDLPIGSPTPDATAAPTPTAPAPTPTPMPTQTPLPTATPPPAPTPTPASPCTYSVSPLNQTLGASGGSGSASVETQARCSWSATSSASWLAVTSGSAATGNGIVRYSASTNPTRASRSAVITAGGKQINVTQAKKRKSS
ncbi:MAG: BACON domain-containing protein [Candidatus Binatia bacterium]